MNCLVQILQVRGEIKLFSFTVSDIANNKINQYFYCIPGIVSDFYYIVSSISGCMLVMYKSKTYKLETYLDFVTVLTHTET